MSREDIQKAKDRILEVLKASGQPNSPQELMRLLTLTALDEATREAIWELLDQKEIELTSDRRLAVAD